VPAIETLDNGLQVGRITVSGIDIELAGAENDLYFQHCLNEAELFQPAIAAASVLLPPDAVLLDIGASLGTVSAAMAQRLDQGRIIAVEAAPSVHPSLRETIRRASDSRITLVEAAVSDHIGVTTFHQDPNGSGWGFLSPDGGTEVNTITVDQIAADLGLNRVDFIKIDVEGGELAVLKGASATLEEHRPIVMFEVNPFCLWRYGRCLPQDLFSWVRERFTDLVSIDEHGVVESLNSDEAVNSLLYQLGMTGKLVDVVASSGPSGLTTESLAAFLPRAPEPPPYVEPEPEAAFVWSPRDDASRVINAISRRIKQLGRRFSR
jgi:FkbM family methyltransferase